MIILATFLLALLTGCQGEDAPRVTVMDLAPSTGDANANDSEEGGKESAGLDDDEGAGKDLETEGAFINAEYRFSVSAMGMTVCEGPVSLKIDPMAAENGGGLLSADGCVECVGNPIHFDEIFGGAGISAGEQDKEDREVELRDHVIGIPNAGPTEFNPPRPIFPSFLAASAEELKAIDVTRNILMDNTETGETGKGQISLKTLTFGQPYTSEVLKGVKVLPNTMTFETVVTGFKTVEDRFHNVLFDKMSMAISLDPIAIPEIKLAANVAQAYALKKDEEEGGSCPGGKGGIMGVLKKLFDKPKKDPAKDTGAGTTGDPAADGGGGGGGGLDGILDKIIPVFGKIVKLEIKLQLVSQEGLENYFDGQE